MTNSFIKVSFIDKPNDFPMLVIENEKGEKIEAIASNLISACIASMGVKYEEVLTEANCNLADNLYKQNFPDCYSKQYKLNSDEGEKLQESLTDLNEFLLDQRDKRLQNLNPSILNINARPIGTGGIRTNVTILHSTKEKAKQIGEGNMSKGIDMCVEAYKTN